MRHSFILLLRQFQRSLKPRGVHPCFLDKMGLRRKTQNKQANTLRRRSQSFCTPYRVSPLTTPPVQPFRKLAQLKELAQRDLAQRTCSEKLAQIKLAQRTSSKPVEKKCSEIKQQKKGETLAQRTCSGRGAFLCGDRCGVVEAQKLEALATSARRKSGGQSSKTCGCCDFLSCPARAALCGDRCGLKSSNYYYVFYSLRDPLRGSAWSICKG